MKKTNKILVVVHNSPPSMRAVKYVGIITAGKRNSVLFLFHRIGPLPPELEEFGGSEHPMLEEKLDEEMRRKREKWLQKAERKARPVLNKAKTILTKAGVPAEAVKTQFHISVNGDEEVDDIIDAARNNHCGTVVFGRERFSWLKNIFQHHTADDLVRKGQGLTVWVVE